MGCHRALGRVLCPLQSGLYQVPMFCTLECACQSLKINRWLLHTQPPCFANCCFWAGLWGESLRANLSTAVSQFAALWVCGSKPHGFSRQMRGRLVSQRQVLRAGSLVWGMNPSLLVEKLWVWGPSCRWVAGPMVRFMARQPQSVLLPSRGPLLLCWRSSVDV